MFSFLRIKKRWNNLCYWIKKRERGKKERKRRIKWRLLRNNIIITTLWCSLLSRFHRFRGHTRRGNDSRRSWLASAIVFPAATAARGSVICSSNYLNRNGTSSLSESWAERKKKKNLICSSLSLSLFTIQNKVRGKQ